MTDPKELLAEAARLDHDWGYGRARATKLRAEAEELTASVQRFDPRSDRKNTPGELRALVEAGLARFKADAISRSGRVCILNHNGRDILYAHYRAGRS